MPADGGVARPMVLATVHTERRRNEVPDRSRPVVGVPRSADTTCRAAPRRGSRRSRRRLQRRPRRFRARGGLARGWGRNVHRTGDRGRAGAVHRPGRRSCRRRIAKGEDMTTAETTGYPIEDATSSLWFGRWPPGWGDVVHGVDQDEACSAAAMIDAAGLAWTVEQHPLEAVVNKRNGSEPSRARVPRVVANVR